MIPQDLTVLESRVVPAGNILVAAGSPSDSSQLVEEYTPGGVKLRTLTIATAGTARDLAVSADGNIHDYFGSIGAALYSYNSASQAWSVHSLAGWSTVNNVSYGGLAYNNGAVYATDMLTAGDNNTQGIVRFNLSDFSAQRYATNISPIDLNIGLDGNLYAIDGSDNVYVYDPSTMNLVRTVTLPSTIGGTSEDYRAVAVDASGNLYLATWGNQVLKFDSGGNYQTGLTLSGLGYNTGGLVDIDVASDGTLIVGSWGGTVFETTTALSGLTNAFSVGGTGPVFVTFAGAAASPPPPTPSVTVNDAAVVEGNSGTTSMTFTVQLSNLYLSPVTINYATADGTATVAAGDYVATSGTLTFQPGTTRLTVSVPVIGNTDPEHNESFTLNLSNPTNCTISRGTATGTIADDDPAPIAQALSASAADILRDYSGNGTFTQEVSDSNGLSVRKFNFNPGPNIPYDERSVMTFDVESIAPQDVSGGTLQVTCTSTTTPQTTIVNVYGYADDGNITLSDATTPAVLLGSFSPTSLTTYTIPLDLAGLLSVLQQGTTHVAIRLSGIPNDNVSFSGTSDSKPPRLTLQVKPPEVSVNDLSVNEGDAANFTVTLSKALATAVTVSYTTTTGATGPNASPNVDYVPVQGTLTFAPGQTSLSVAVQTIGDPASDSGETFGLLLYNATSPIAYVHSLGTATIVDVTNPTPGIKVSNISVTQGTTGTTPATFTVTLSVPSQNTVTVNYATADGTATSPTDYQSTSGTLTFAPGQTSQNVTVTVNGENRYDGNESFTLNLSNPTNAVLVNPGPMCTIINNVPEPSLSVASTSVVKQKSEPRSAVFTVSLSGPSDFTTTVNWYTSDGTALAGEDYQGLSGQVTFAAGQTSAQISVPVYGNAFTEGNKTFTVNLYSPYNATINTGTATGTIIDNNPASGTMEFTASSWGYADDNNGDGVFDALFVGGSGTPVNANPSNNAQERSLYEFDVSRVVSGVVNSVAFTFVISSYTSNGGPVNIGGFAGSGTVALSDATRSVSLLGSYQPSSLGVTSITLDRAAVLAIVGNSHYLGLRLDPGTSYVNTSLDTPTAVPADAPFVTFHADLPVAFADTYSTNENVTLSVPTPSSVLVNDYRVSGTTLTAAVVQPPGHGSLTLNSDGSFSYVPAQYFNGTDQFTYQVSDGTNTSAPATVSITVNPVNQRPSATPATMTLPDSGAASMTLQGTDIETPGSELVYTVTSLPANGTLYQPNGSAVLVGETFTGSAATLTYLLPTEVLGSLSDSFTFTVTDNGDPDGNSSNKLTSTAATVAIQTPANSAGILRIGGGLGNDTFVLSGSNGNTTLHVLVNGSSPGSDVAFASITSIELFGRNGTNSYTIPAGLPVPISVTGGTGADALSAGPDHLTFNGGGGSDTATISLDSSAGTTALAPGSGTITDGSNTITLANVATITVNGNGNSTATLNDSTGNDTFTASPTFGTMTGPGYSIRANKFASVTAISSAGGTDSAHLSDTSGSNTFTASPTSARFSGAGFTEIATGFGVVYGTAAAGTTDNATLSDSSGSNTFTGTPTYGLFYGTGFYNKATGFASVKATAGAGTTDAATLSDTSGSNTLTATPTTATFSGSGFSNSANGFTSVVANAAAGTTDAATLYGSSGNDSFTATPTVGTMTGPAYSNRANLFAHVTGISGAGGTDSAHLSDASGSNTFTATPTTATFSGNGFAETASGFGVVYGTAAAGTTDSATLTDSAGSNHFTGTPGYGLFYGTGFYNKASGFASVLATAAPSTTDAATLSDTSGSNTFTATPALATFSGSGFANSAKGFTSVVANAAAATTDTATLYDSSGNDTFTAMPTFGTMTGAGYMNRANHFASVTGMSSGGGADSAHLSDTSGSNTFTAASTTATFSGNGFSETATGFSAVYGTTAAGTTDTATLSDSAGSNHFAGTPTYGLFYGIGFYNKATGFVSVLATAAAGTTDFATLSDTNGSNTFTATPTSAIFTGGGFSNTATGFAKVVATAASGTTDTAVLSDTAPQPGTFTGSPTSAAMAGTRYNNLANGFAIVQATIVNSSDVANLSDGPSGAQFTGNGNQGALVGSGSAYSITVTMATSSTMNLTGSTGTNLARITQAIDYVLNKLGSWLAD
jgi:hypothetical protein